MPVSFYPSDKDMVKTVRWDSGKGLHKKPPPRINAVGFAASSSSLRCSSLCSLQPAGCSSSGERIRRTPYHWWNLSSPAAPWPPKPANDLLSLLEEGALTKGEGYGFSVTVCTQGRGLNLGLERLGLSWIALGLRAQNQREFGPDSAQIWPGSTP